MKFIVDTGATHSIVNPGVCNPKWKISSQAVTLKTLQTEILSDTIYQIPMFSELGDSCERIYLIECRFHDDYNGIIGNDILRNYSAIVDYSTNQLCINNRTVPLLFPTFRQVKLITPVEKGLIHILEHRNDIGEIIVDESVYNARNFKVEVKTRAKCPDIIYLKEENSWPVTPENYHLIGENSLKDGNRENSLLEKINLDHLNSEEKSELTCILNRYNDLFYETNSNLSFTNVIKHRIITKNEIPIFSKTYRYPYIHKNEVRNQIQEMLESGIIRPSNSPYSDPIWIVPRKDDASGQKKWRLVIDYRKLNENTVDDRFPIPNIEEILDKLGRCMYFSTLDLAKGFHQVEIDERHS